MSQQRLEFFAAADAHQGARSYQEDSIKVWRPDGKMRGGEQPVLAVLSDGMGGHVSGEVASRTACDRYVANFKSGSRDSNGKLETLLEHSLIASNDALGSEIRKNNALNGMGCTLVAAYLDQDGVRWVSVGDSSLMLWNKRSGELSRLNEDHSLGALLDKQVEAKIISAEEAKADPRRRTLRSALTGGQIAVSEIRTKPVPLGAGDWILLASDGLETLSGNEIAGILRRHENATTPDAVVKDLLREVNKRGVPHQDNVSIIAVKIDDPDETRMVGDRNAQGAAFPDETQPVPQSGPQPARSNGSSMPRRSEVSSAGGLSTTTKVVVGTVVMVLALLGLYWTYNGPPVADVVNPNRQQPLTGSGMPVGSGGATTSGGSGESHSSGGGKIQVPKANPGDKSDTNKTKPGQREP